MSMGIPRFDHREQYRTIRREVLEAIDQVLESSSLILGPRVREFEEQFAHHLGSGGHAVGVACGTDALAIALRALEIGPGDEVITVAHTAAGTISAIRMAGATPVFCDIDPDTLQMDARDAARRIRSVTRAIIPVHVYGNAVDMPAITHLAGGFGLKVIEDCAQACGTTLNGRAVGTFGDVGCFSFYPTKNLAAYGDGGLCLTADRALAERMRNIRNYGFGPIATAEVEGVNSRLDEVQAAILTVKLRYLAQYLHHRRAIGQAYRSQLSSRCVIPKTTDGAEHSHHLFVIQVEQRERVISRLRDAGIEAGIHYATPVHLIDAYRSLGNGEGSLPVTERASTRVLSLPCYPELPIESVERVCAVVNDAVTG